MKKVFCLLIILFSLDLYSCSCSEINSVSEKFSKANFVAKGKIVKNYKNKGEEDTYKSDIEIDQLYKGEEIKSLLVSGNNGADIFSSCDIFIKEGTELIFYGYKNYKGKLQIGMCSGLVYSNQKDRFKKELEILNNLKIFKDKNFNKVVIYSKDFSNNLKQFNGISLKKRYALFKIQFDDKLNIINIKTISGFGKKDINNKLLDVIKKSSWEIPKNSKTKNILNKYNFVVDIYYYSKQGNNKSFLSIFNL